MTEQWGWARLAVREWPGVPGWYLAVLQLSETLLAWGLHNIQCFHWQELFGYTTPSLEASKHTH